MTTPSYYAQHGGLPSQTQLLTDRAVFKEAYAFIPRGVMRDIVTSYLPFWDKTRAWIIARPLSGFAETFSQYLMEVAPSGGSETPEPNSSSNGKHRPGHEHPERVDRHAAYFLTPSWGVVPVCPFI
jgi:(S)-ureidoglycine aminohydrolase